MDTITDSRRQIPCGRIFRRLADSALYRTYREAFVAATGLPLSLIPVNKEDHCQDLSEESGNAFCLALNCGGNACRDCSKVDRGLREEKLVQARTVTCFAGMKETAVPVRSGGRTLAILRTGQVFVTSPDAEAFTPVRAMLERRSREGESDPGMEGKWWQGKVVSREHYEGAVTLLAAFALQLSDLQNRIFLEEEEHESDLVRTAKRFIGEHLEDRISLESLARVCGVSTFYFCKVFKKSTGMTLTEYVNRRRIEWSKAKLMIPDSRVVEVAFDVGFQSLSQFNRCFRKYVGMAPTRFREKDRGNRNTPHLVMVS